MKKTKGLYESKAYKDLAKHLKDRDLWDILHTVIFAIGEECNNQIDRLMENKNRI